MCAPLNYFAFIHDQNRIGLRYSRQSMSNDECGGAVLRCEDSIPNGFFSDRIQCGRGFVKYENVRFF